VKATIVPLSTVLTQDTASVLVQPDQTYRSAGILNRGRGLFDKGDLAGADTSYKSLFPIKAGQAIYSKLFGWEGAVTTVSADFDGSFMSSEFPHFDVDQTTINSAYLDHYLKSPVFAELLATAGSGLGQRRQRVSVGTFLALPVPIPSRTDQDRIAAHLDSLAEPMSRAAQSADRATGLLDLLREHVLGGLVEGGLMPLQTVLRQIDGLEDVEPEKEYSTLGVRSFGRGAFASGSVLGSETAYKKLRRFEAGQVCYPKLMAWQGAFAVIPDELDGYFASPEFVGFEVDQTLTSSEYVGHCLRWSAFAAGAESASTGTNANRRRLQPNDFLSLSFPLPARNVQDAISAALSMATAATAKARVVAGLAAATLSAARNDVFASPQP